LIGDVPERRSAIGPCLDEQTVLDFFGGELSLDQLAQLEQHMDGCPACFALITAATPVLCSPEESDGAPIEDVSEGILLAGRYRVAELLGVGASGRVFRAADELAGVQVALKVLRRELTSDPAWIRRSRRELVLARQLRHENVCRLFDLHIGDGRRFLTMELAVRSLRSELSAGYTDRDLSGRIADALAIVRGLTAIHRGGVVHRDLKPENILRLPDGRLVVSDFGFANTSLPAGDSVSIVGTPAYMAPEVLAGASATARSDIWSCGTLLHEMLIGGRPTRGPSPNLTSIQKACLRLCRRCVDPVAGRRPHSADELLRSLGRLAIRARHPTAFRAGSAVLVVAALSICVASGLTLARHPRRTVSSSGKAAVVPGGEAPPWAAAPTDPVTISGVVLDEDEHSDLAPRFLRDLGTRLATVPGVRYYSNVAEQSSLAVDGRVQLWIGSSSTGNRSSLRVAVRTADGKYARSFPLDLPGSALRAGILPPGRAIERSVAQLTLYLRQLREARRATSSEAAFVALRAYYNRVYTDEQFGMPDTDKLREAFQADAGYVPALREMVLLALFFEQLSGPRSDWTGPAGLGRRILADYQVKAPADPYLEPVRCMFLTTFLDLDPEPTDADSMAAYDSCVRSASRFPEEPALRMAVARVRLHGCDASGALGLVEETEGRSLAHRGVTLGEWARIALQWNDRASLERLDVALDDAVQVDEVPHGFAAALGPVPSSTMIAAAVRMRLGRKEGLEQLLERASRGPVVAMGIPLEPAARTALAQLRYGPSYRQSADYKAFREAIRDVVGRHGDSGRNIVTLHSWFDPADGPDLLAPDASTKSCGDTLRTALLLHGAGRIQAVGPLLASCARRFGWARACRKRLTRISGPLR
jgi:serine/threonine protein kinase